MRLQDWRIIYEFLGKAFDSMKEPGRYHFPVTILHIAPCLVLVPEGTAFVDIRGPKDAPVYTGIDPDNAAIGYLLISSLSSSWLRLATSTWIHGTPEVELECPRSRRSKGPAPSIVVSYKVERGTHPCSKW